MKNNLYQQIYTYSKKCLSFKRRFTNLIVKLCLYSLFGILIYFSIDVFNYIEDKIVFLLLIILSILISSLIELIWQEHEIKRLKKQEKSHADSFIKLFESHESAQKDIKARDEFLSIVSHELRTPLNIMLLKLHSELNKIQSASLANFSVNELVSVLKNSELQIKRLKSIVNDLVDISLITTGRIALQKENTDLVDITKQVKTSFSEVLKRSKIKLNVKSKSPVIGKWDKMRIEQVITNLFSNAIKYGNNKPIEIQILKSGSNAKFIIKDNGIGISNKEQKLIFDLFKRAEKTKEYKKGLGVGLFITDQIVKIHEGKIKLSSTPSFGTTFTVELPLKT